MKAIVYILFRGFQRFVSLIPFKVLYILSDIIAFIFQYVMRYRVEIVTDNLRKAFPEKSDNEIKEITSKFYKNLSDIFLESIKGYSLSTEELLKRYRCLNPEVADLYFSKGMDVIFALSHYGNWEWGTQIASTYFKHSVVSFYKPIANRYIDNFIFQNRKNHNMNLASVYQTKFIFRSHDEKPKAYFMVSDQSPNKRKNVYWIKFLNQDTACMHGIESYARLFNLPVIYSDVQRTKRGYYTIKLEVISHNSIESEPGEITTKYMQKLEEIIVKKPEDWLWSHRRWKMKITEKPKILNDQKSGLVIN